MVQVCIVSFFLKCFIKLKISISFAAHADDNTSYTWSSKMEHTLDSQPELLQEM